MQYFHHRAASLNVSDIFTLACNAKRSRPSVASKAIGAVNAASKNSGEPSMIPTRTWSRIRKTQYGNLLFVLIRGFDKPEIGQPGMRGQHPPSPLPTGQSFRRIFDAASDDPDMEFAMLDATIVKVHRHAQKSRLPGQLLKTILSGLGAHSRMTPIC